MKTKPSYRIAIVRTVCLVLLYSTCSGLFSGCVTKANKKLSKGQIPDATTEIAVKTISQRLATAQTMLTAMGQNPTNSTPPSPGVQSSREILAKQIADAAKLAKDAEEAKNALSVLAAEAQKAVGPQPKITARFQLMADEKAIEEFGAAFGKAFYVGEVSVENQEDKPFLAYGASLLMHVKYYVSEKDLADIAQIRPDLLLQLANKGYLPDIRRPSTYPDIISVFDYEREDSTKQQFINYLKSAGEIAAGATVFVHGRDYSKVVALITGVITPELEKRLLWDIILHSKNLEARSFKELEEIPAGSGITRVVFFPRGGITGIVDNHQVFLSSFDFSQPVGISGSLITKDPKQAQPQ